MNNEISKKLVYHFYAPEEFTENRAIMVHLNNLKRYADVFNESIFVIAVDNIENIGLIKKVEKEIIDCGYFNATFKVKQNGKYRETTTFYEEIVKNLNKIDGLVFFGHTKGVTNYSQFPENKVDIDHWLTGLYYFNLEFINEVELSLVDHHCAFYGAYLHVDSNEITLEKVPGIYFGTFFWINVPQVNHLIQNGLTFKKPNLKLTNRGYAEEFPYLISDWRNGEGLASHVYRATYEHNIYTTASSLTEFFCGSKEEYNKFLDIVKEYDRID